MKISPRIIARLLHIDQRPVVFSERAVRTVKEGSSAVLLQSGRKVGGQILWNVTLIWETSQIYDLMRRRPMKDVLGNHLKDLLFHLVHWLSITSPYNFEGSVKNPSIWKKSYLDCSSDTHCTREEFGRVMYWSQTLRSWRRWTHRKCTRKDSMRRR